MSLSIKDLSDISLEFSAAKETIDSTKKNIGSLTEQVQKLTLQSDRQYILYRNIQNERVSPYQIERQWLDGTIYTDISESDISAAASRTTTNQFFPSTWSKNNAYLAPSANGNPKSTNSNNESSKINGSALDQGLLSQISLLTSGQSSIVGNHTLHDDYIPGSGTIQLFSGTQTVGKLLYISGSGTSALVIVTGAVGDIISITEIISPTGIIVKAGSVVENIPGFTNLERQTLTSGAYQHILTELTNRIINSASIWNTSMSNQMTQLSLNIDSPSQVTSAKNNLMTGQSAYSTWNALSNTGANGKFVDANLNNLINNGISSRNSFLSTRISQITNALGIVNQGSDGYYSGSGLYVQRFKFLNYLINSADGPLFQLAGLNVAKSLFQDKITNNVDKISTYSGMLAFTSFSKDSDGTNSISVDNASHFSISDSVLVTGADLPSIQCTISNISGSTITLNKNVPKEFKKTSKAGIIKVI